MRKLLYAGLLLLVTQMPAMGMQFYSRTDLTLDQSTRVEEDLYLAGEKVNFTGEARQDLFVAASTRAVISGNVGQDLNMAAVNAEVNGQVGDDLRILASELVVTGQVLGSSLMIATDVFAKPQSIFEQDCWMIGEEVHMAGMAKSNVRISASKVFIDGTIMGDMRIEAESIVFSRRARVLGRVDYTSGQDIQISSGAVVQNTPVRQTGSNNEFSQKTKSGWQNFISVGKIFFFITMFLGVLALGCLLLVMLPVPTRRFAQVMRYRFWPCLGWGLLTSMGVGIFMLFLLVSIIGIPLAAILGVLSVVVIAAAEIGIGYMLGLVFLRSNPLTTGKSIGAFLLGFTILSLLSLIPVVGVIIFFLVMVLGFGAVWLTKNFVEPGQRVTALAAEPNPEQPPATTEAETKTSVGLKPVAEPLADEKSVHVSGWKPPVPAFKQQTGSAPKTKSQTGKPAVRKKAIPSRTKSVMKKAVAKKIVKKSSKKAVKKNSKKPALKK